MSQPGPVGGSWINSIFEESVVLLPEWQALNTRLCEEVKAFVKTHGAEIQRKQCIFSLLGPAFCERHFPDTPFQPYLLRPPHMMPQVLQTLTAELREELQSHMAQYMKETVVKGGWPEHKAYQRATRDLVNASFQRQVKSSSHQQLASHLVKQASLRSVSVQDHKAAEEKPERLVSTRLESDVSAAALVELCQRYPAMRNSLVGAAKRPPRLVGMPLPDPLRRYVWSLSLAPDGVEASTVHFVDRCRENAVSLWGVDLVAAQAEAEKRAERLKASVTQQTGLSAAAAAAAASGSAAITAVRAAREREEAGITGREDEWQWSQRLASVRDSIPQRSPVQGVVNHLVDTVLGHADIADTDSFHGGAASTAAAGVELLLPAFGRGSLALRMASRQQQQPSKDQRMRPATRRELELRRRLRGCVHRCYLHSDRYGYVEALLGLQLLRVFPEEDYSPDAVASMLVLLLETCLPHAAVSKRMALAVWQQVQHKLPHLAAHLEAIYGGAGTTGAGRSGAAGMLGLSWANTPLSSLQLIERWLSTGFVGHLTFRASAFVWDQCFQLGWTSSAHVLQRVCLVIFRNLERRLLEVDSITGLDAVCAVGPCIITTKDLARQLQEESFAV